MPTCLSHWNKSLSWEVYFLDFVLHFAVPFPVADSRFWSKDPDSRIGSSTLGDLDSKLQRPLDRLLHGTLLLKITGDYSIITDFILATRGKDKGHCVWPTKSKRRHQRKLDNVKHRSTCILLPTGGTRSRSLDLKQTSVQVSYPFAMFHLSPFLCNWMRVIAGNVQVVVLLVKSIATGNIKGPKCHADGEINHHRQQQVTTQLCITRIDFIAINSLRVEMPLYGNPWCSIHVHASTGVLLHEPWIGLT